MQSLLAKWWKRVAVAALVLVLLAGGLVVLVLNHNGLQDRLAKGALTRGVAQQMERSAAYGGDNLDLVFCGTASPMGNARRAQQCMGVLAGDKFFIIDSGARSTAVAVNMALPVERLDGVLLTHFHSDHISSLGELHLASWARGRVGQLPLYGGPGVEWVATGFNMAYGLDYGYRTAHHGEAAMPSAHSGFVAQPFKVPTKGSTVIFDEGGLKISAFSVPHPPIEPAVGFRFDYRGRSLVISGDTAYSDNLVAEAKNTEVLVHEVLQRDLVSMTSETLAEMGQENLGKIIYDTHDYHTSPVEAAKVANRANAKMLVFTHMAPSPASGLVERIFMRGVREIRKSGTIMADDGMHIRLPAPVNGGNSEIIVK